MENQEIKKEMERCFEQIKLNNISFQCVLIAQNCNYAPCITRKYPRNRETLCRFAFPAFLPERSAPGQQRKPTG